MCNDSSNPSPCNRRPFASDDGCDRGSVDIFQFEDLPYCDKIDPTMPDIPPEVADGPVPIPLPTYTCSCFNIDYKFDMKYSGNRAGNSFSTSASFAAIGDCCEGRYETSFKLRIPCPVKNRAGRKIKVGIAYGSGPQSASASFISADSSNCVIEPLAPSLNLNIPCPLMRGSGGPDSAPGKMRVGIGYGNGPSIASASFLAGNSGTCEMEVLSPTVRLNIPCPIRTVKGPKKIKVGISYGNGAAEASANYASADPETCAMSPRDASLKLNIPCPIMGTEGEKKIKASVRYGNGPSATTQTLAVANVEKCTLDIRSPEIDLNIPCPLGNLTFNANYKTVAGDVGNLDVSQAYDPAKCRDVVNISVAFPLGTGYSGLSRYVKETTYINGSLEVCYGYKQYKNGRVVKVYDGGCVTLFTAVPHGGCC